MKRSLVLLGALVALTSNASAEAVDSFSANYYAETNEQVRLFLKTELSNGKTILVPKFTVPAETILSFDVLSMSESIELQKTSPGRVNQEYSENESGSNSRMSKSGWICNIRVVDINDEDLRSSDYLDREDFCLSQTMLSRLEIVEGNSEPVKEAMALLKNENDDRLLQSVSVQVAQIAAQEEWEEQNLPVQASSAKNRMISPIKNCGQGCIYATSEYGMRRHPVLKTRRLHKGIDLRAQVGTPVVAVFDGKVLANRSESKKDRKGRVKLKGYGHYTIVVYPKAGLQSLYAHLSKHGTRPGTAVSQGQVVAYSGNTGLGSGPHLHFETHTIKRGSALPQNPRLFLNHLFKRLASLFSYFDLSQNA